MIKKIFFLIIFIFSVGNIYAQNRYKIFFTDKNSVEFNPAEYFCSKTIERRIKYGIPLNDISDYPLNSSYVEAVAKITEKITTEIRWFNLVFADATPEQIIEIEKLPFVKKTEPVNFSAKLCNEEFDTSMTNFDRQLLEKQLSSMQAEYFAANNTDGKGIRIAVFDGGFPDVDKSPVFEHIRKRNGIIKTYDFAKKNEFVYSYNKHGRMVLSCIAGMSGNKKLGAATGAEFLLARTEINTEPFSEEENWLAAVEWADKNGADIINSSLGYTVDRYFPQDMNGQISLVSRAANLAAKKGILVINAMGNDGDSKWKVLGAPADADSVLSIGGIDPETGVHQSFSSLGPTSDFRAKPNVCAFSTAITAGSKNLVRAQGTSFATPLITGFAACAWQTNTNLTNMQIFEEIQKSGNLYPYYDYAHGYGIPQATYFDSVQFATIPSYFLDITETDTAFEIKTGQNFSDGEYIPQNYVYYKISDKDGEIIKYYLIELKNKKDIITIGKNEYKGKILEIRYKDWYRKFEI